MPDVFLPVTPMTTTRKEVRAVAAVATNDVDASHDDPTVKYGFEIHRVLEPQDSTGASTGPREKARPLKVSMADVLSRTFTRADGSTFSGADHLADHLAVIDYYKAQDLT